MEQGKNRIKGGIKPTVIYANVQRSKWQKDSLQVLSPSITSARAEPPSPSPLLPL